MPSGLVECQTGSAANRQTPYSLVVRHLHQISRTQADDSHITAAVHHLHAFDLRGIISVGKLHYGKHRFRHLLRGVNPCERDCSDA